MPVSTALDSSLLLLIRTRTIHAFHSISPPYYSKEYTKLDWHTFLSATFFDDSSPPKPSAFSNTLNHRFYLWANETTSRVAISDWVHTVSPTMQGFQAR